MIGELKESSLHEALKHHYARKVGGAVEHPAAGYLVDIFGGSGTAAEIIEIQTGSFTSLRTKLARLLAEWRVRVVYPVMTEKVIRLFAADGTTLRHERRSPLKAVPASAARELMRIPEAVLHPRFSLEMVLVSVVEERIDDGTGSWRRNGVRIADRKLSSISDSIIFDSPGAYLSLLPSGLPERFTNKDIASLARITPGLAGQLTWFLRRIEVVEAVGRRGRSLLLKIDSRISRKDEDLPPGVTEAAHRKETKQTC